MRPLIKKGQCIRTRDITEDDYILILNHCRELGYSVSWKLQEPEHYRDCTYIGVDDTGDVCSFDYWWSYIAIDALLIQKEEKDVVIVGERLIKLVGEL